MRGRHGSAFQQADAVGEKAQLAVGGDARIELAQAAGGRIARIGELLLPGVARMVRILAVTSSPVAPSPRVAACMNTPFS